MATTSNATTFETTVPETAIAELSPVLPREEKIKRLQALTDDLVVSIIDGVETELTTIEDKYNSKNIPEDMSVEENFDFVHVAIQVLKKPRIALEKGRKDITSPLNTTVKKINAAVKPYSLRYAKLETPWISAKKDFLISEEIRIREESEAESARIKNIEDKILNIRALPGNQYADSAEIAIALKNLDDHLNDYDWAMEFADVAKETHEQSLQAVKNLYNLTLADEERRANETRAAKERQEREDAERKAEDERLAKQREEQNAFAAKLEAAQKKIDDENNKLIAAKAKIEADKKDEEQAEKTRLAKIEADKIAETERERKIEEAVKSEKEAKEKALSARENNISEAMSDIAQHGLSLENIVAGLIRHIAWVD